jgi:hypothetical protein
VLSRALLLAVAAVALLGGCGEDEPSDSAPAGSQRAAGGANEAPAPDEPGAPDPGDPVYSGLGSWWVKLDSDRRISSAAEFIAANPDDCPGLAAEDLERQTRIAYGLEFPLNTTVSAVMLETCALLLDEP